MKSVEHGLKGYGSNYDPHNTDILSTDTGIGEIEKWIETDWRKSQVIRQRNCSQSFMQVC